MPTKRWFSALFVLLPATAVAQNLSDTHERISVPGKTINAYRPIEQNRLTSAKCHPDATKAVACEAIAQHARAAALASQRKAEAIELGSR